MSGVWFWKLPCVRKLPTWWRQRGAFSSTLERFLKFPSHLTIFVKIPYWTNCFFACPNACPTQNLDSKWRGDGFTKRVSIFKISTPKASGLCNLAASAVVDLQTSSWSAWKGANDNTSKHSKLVFIHWIKIRLKLLWSPLCQVFWSPKFSQRVNRVN